MYQDIQTASLPIFVVADDEDDQDYAYKDGGLGWDEDEFILNHDLVR